MKQRAALKIVAVVVALGLLIFFGTADAAQFLRSGAFRLIAPAFGGTTRVARALRDRMLGFSEEQVRAWEAERGQFIQRLAELTAIRRENETLRAALALRSEGEEGAIPAEAIAFFRDGRDEYVVLNHGIADGVSVGDIVVDTRRVLGGTVVAVDPHAARAILFSSPSRSTDVTIPSADLRAIARGSNARELSIELVPPDAAVKAGDIVLASPRVTAGRRPLLLGEIREVRQAEQEVFKTVRAVHLFDPAESAVIILLAP